MISSKIEMQAYFKMQATNVDTGEVRELTDWFPNVVLDSGLVQMSQGTWYTGVNVGSGNSTPVITQTGLDTFVARSTNKIAGTAGRQTTTSPYYYWIKDTVQFGQGAAAGNLSEVALGWSNSGCWNRALIKDSNGNPTTITILANEFLNVLVELRVYPNMNDVVTTVDLLDAVGGNVISSHTVTVRPCMDADLNTQSTTYNSTVGNGKVIPYYYGGGEGGSVANPICYSGTLNEITSLPTTQLAAATKAQPPTTYPTTTSMKCTTSLTISETNGSHRCCVFISPMGKFKCEYSPPITKDNTQTLSHSWTLSWGRYTG